MARMPEIARNEENKDAYDYLHKTRGAVRGGFAITLTSPDLTQRMAHVGTYVRFDSPLPKLFTELGATAISAELENPAEVAPHSKNCRDLQVTPALLDAVLARTPVTAGTDDEKLVVSMARELVHDHKLKDSTFAAAKLRLGDKGVIDMIGALGYYAMLAVVHTALDLKPKG